MQGVDVERLLLVHHAVEGYGPGADVELLRCVEDALVRAELVEVVVGGGEALVGDRTRVRV